MPSVAPKVLLKTLPKVLVKTGGLFGAAATNLIRWSTVYTNSAWTKAQGGNGVIPVVTAAAGISPDGTMDATSVVFVAPASGDQSILAESLTVVNGGSHTAGLWINALGAGDVGKVIGLRHVAGILYGLITLTASWQRFTRTEVSAGTNEALQLNLRPFSGTSTGTVSVLLWNAQVEAGTFSSTDIIRTT